MLVERPHLRALIGTNLDDLCADLDVSRAVATLLLRGLFHAQQPDFDAGLTTELQEITERRHTEAKGRLLVFIESTAPLDFDLNRSHHEEHGIVVGFDLVDRVSVARPHREATRAILAALSLAARRDINTHKLSEGLYCRDDAGKRYLSYTFTAHGAGLVVSSAPEALAAVADYVTKCEARKDLGRIVRLAADAAERSGRFRMWLSAWTALESLITIRFNRYEPLFLEQLRGGRTDAPTLHYFERIADVIGERYRLLDKFAVIAGCLFPERAGADVEGFKGLKKQCDNVMHGAEVSDTDLRAEAVRELLRRYLEADLMSGR